MESGAIPERNSQSFRIDNPSRAQLNDSEPTKENTVTSSSTSTLPSGMDLPARLSDINADFMTRLLRARGLLADHNEIIRIDESGVGMTAGYFSDIKKLHCHFKEPTECPSHFVAKAWPDFEMLPGETISDMFVKDIKGYMLPAEHFFPRPEVFLADFDQTSNHYGLIMADVDQFGTQKVHEQELTFDEVMQMIPGLVDCAVSWEGCDTGPAASTLTEFGVAHWSSPENLALYKEIMPAGAKLFDKVLSMPESDLTGGASWQAQFGTGVAELFTQKLDAHFAQIDPSTGATCTLSHGDLRGDNLFFCPKSDANPEGWLTIDFQLMFKGPVPSDLAYLMSSGSVLPEVYSAANRDQILKAFYDQFMGKTLRYPDYTFQQFQTEFAAMCTVMFIYYVGMGGAIWRAAAFENEQPGRIELGSEPFTVDDLAPDELRKRMWWRKTIANNRVLMADLDLVGLWQTMPDNTDGMGDWVNLPPHLSE